MARRTSFQKLELAFSTPSAQSGGYRWFSLRRSREPRWLRRGPCRRVRAIEPLARLPSVARPHGWKARVRDRLDPRARPGLWRSSRLFWLLLPVADRLGFGRPPACLTPA